ncbi:MAG TPA: F0F1 ATP synthase subunit A [Dictyoglomaceae bacterium]|nr:F0F1 ATP synthase subunit A [Dictyoglomaceae bacterium]HOL39286.1 F0F1 ATP synthase subunit A [Dictyoglomaceae bacterium]HPP15855.1 F0F1 ATP synthase subunit A [Dictyoglomaceae bacterium]
MEQGVEIGPRVVGNILGIPITNTFISLQVVSIVVAVLVGFLSYKPKETLTTKQNIAETLLEMFKGFLTGFLEEPIADKYLPFFATLFSFILLSNWSGFIPGFTAPTSDINVTAGLAIATILYIQYAAFKERGWEYFKSFISPSVIFLPINLMEQITRPVSLALRLFGNISGEHIVLAIITLLAPLIIPIPIMALNMFMGFIQAFIFTSLGAAYLAAALEE